MKPKVLIVEDNEDIALLFSTVLSVSGMESMIASSLAQAKQLLIKHSFDAMVVDFSLRDGKGPALLNAYGVPPVCIMVSGQCKLESAFPGFQEYLVKPVSCDVMVDAITSRLKEKVA